MSDESAWVVRLDRPVCGSGALAAIATVNRGEGVAPTTTF